MSSSLRARVAAKTAIFRGERILLLHRALHAANPGIWDLPGGQLYTGESLFRAARRETKEETGFDVRIGPAFYADIFSSLSKRGKMRRVVGVYFHCTAPARKTPQLDPEEHSEFAWVTLADLDDYPTVPHLSRTIREAFATRTAGHRPRAVGRTASLTETDSVSFPVPA
ncbi:MAG: NUDIX hydrolase [Thermoplasmata archaeon]|jgi:8-oxo-dGTP pyrophosphatase MutT (NUDIX family)